MPFAVDCNRLPDMKVKPGEAAIIQFRYTDENYTLYRMWVEDDSGRTAEFSDMDTSRGVTSKSGVIPSRPPRRPEAQRRPHWSPHRLTNFDIRPS